MAWPAKRAVEDDQKGSPSSDHGRTRPRQARLRPARQDALINQAGSFAGELPVTELPQTGKTFFRLLVF
jgi:hypothetical protein